MRVGDIDDSFNRQLAILSSSNADSIVFNLGLPSRKVLSAGVSNKPLKLYGNKVMKKIRKHGYMIEELKDLTKAVRNPIAVFKNKSEEGSFSILTSLKTKNGNFLVAIRTGVDADCSFNIVSTVFGKGNEKIIDWINTGYLRYVDKEKALSYLLHQSAPIAAALNREELFRATNIVRHFRNNQISPLVNVVG